MPPDRRERAEAVVMAFEERLEKLVDSSRIPRRHIRPLVMGSVISGAYQDSLLVGYLPQLGMPTVTFMMLHGRGAASPIAFHNFLMDRTGQDFCIVHLRDDWLSLSQETKDTTMDNVAAGIIQSELSRLKVNTMIIPFNPISGQNRYPIQESLVFVLMPFDDALAGVYNNIIKPTIEENNLVARRADDISSNNAIVTDIWKSICEARFVVADLTGRNPNVMYELGIAHTVGKETILINQMKDEVRFPFDISHIRIITYENTAQGGAELRSKLGSTIENVMEKLGGGAVSG